MTAMAKHNHKYVCVATLCPSNPSNCQDVSSSFPRLVRCSFLEPAAAFVTAPGPTRSGKVAMSMSQSDDQERKFAASVLTAAYLFANAVSVAPAVAAFQDFGSTEIVAARSGGRTGGRVSSGTRGASPSYKAPTNTRVVERTTVIQQPSVVAAPVVVAPPVYGGYGYGYGGGLDAGAVGMSNAE